MTRPQTKKPRKLKKLTVPCYLQLDPCLIARVLRQLEKVNVLPKATVKEIIHAGLLQYAMGQNLRTETTALEELHTYGVKLRELLPQSRLARSARADRERRRAYIERERFLLSLEPPPVSPTAPEDDPARDLDKAFYQALYGPGPGPGPSPEPVKESPDVLA
jgi:hypothetical protein